MSFGKDRITRSLLVAATLPLLSGTLAAGQSLLLRTEVRGLLHPIAITHAGDGSDRLFIALRDGRIIERAPGTRRGEIFLDLADRISCCAQEQGLLGLAFHPDFADNGQLYVNYTDPEGDSVVTRFTVSPESGRPDASSATRIFVIEQPGGFHNSAHLAFGPDGFLYVGAGDGATGGDEADNAQNLASPLGKILRLDVDGATPYRVPANNPFAATPGALPEIWSYGLRNPWRFSFDRETGDLYIGDVGENSFEEIDFQPAASTGGENYGWRRKEGTACFEPASNCDEDELVEPIFAYPHEERPEALCSGSVTGGYRYRGPRVPTLSGLYVFGDFCTGTLWGGRRNAQGNWLFRRLLESRLPITALGEDERGRLYVAALGKTVYRLLGRPLFRSGFEDPGLAEWSRKKGPPRVRPEGLRGTDGALALDLDGTSRRVFVRSLDLEDERFVRIGFDLDVNRAELGGARIEILRIGGELPVLALLLDQRGGRYTARVVASEIDGSRRLVGTVGLPGAKTVRLEIEWMQATDGTDGEVVLRKNGRERARVSDLATGRLTARSVLLGLPAGSERAVGGSLLIDNYISSR